MEPRQTIARVEPGDLLLLGRREPFLDWHLNLGEAENLAVEASHEADVVCGDVDVMDTGLRCSSCSLGVRMYGLVSEYPYASLFPGACQAR